MDEVDVAFLRSVPVVMESREAIQLCFPIERIHPVVAQIFEELAIHAQGGPGRDGFGPSCPVQAEAKVVPRRLRKWRNKRVHHRQPAREWPLVT